jgi:hypothetical protein
MQKIFLMLIIGLFLGTSCRREAKEVAVTNNNSFHVELLFEVDGCKVYRFWDGGYRYFTQCSGSVQWKTNDKNHTQYEIQTDKN